jgi:hypothetical protein
MAEILDNKHPGSLSLFRATALLREAWRQKGLPMTTTFTNVRFRG